MHDDCDPEALLPRARALLDERDDPPDAAGACGRRGCIEAINWIAEWEREDRRSGRLPLKAEIAGETEIAGVMVNGKADRIDRLADGGLAIVDYKTGKAPAQKAVDKGFALQLGLARADCAARADSPRSRANPKRIEYWSLTKDRDKFGKQGVPGQEHGRGRFPRPCRSAFSRRGAANG